MGDRGFGEDTPAGLAWHGSVPDAQCPFPNAAPVHWQVPSEDARLNLVLGYFERMIEFRGEQHAMHVIRQKISWLGKTINGGHCKPLREAVRTAKDPVGVRGAVEAWRSGGMRVEACQDNCRD
jgi:tRNA-dihydrouridine synthase